ncbi:MAG: disulfide oxidoreductase [Desulfuromonadaceae bacterium GWC2_58_13]|nr:MAG: disulfide oxidoreductase [Desulfuromonadaceae bacterium GWC2_58_13]
MITRDMMIEDVIQKHPETIAVFKKFGLDCNECQIAAYEDVEHGAGVHSIDVEALLAELNRLVSR